MGTRHPFGGGIADWAFITAGNGAVTATAGVAITAWSAQQGGTQYTGLSLDQAGLTPVTGVITSDGTDGYGLGEIPVFYGPEDVFVLYLSGDGGPRVAVGSIDTAALAGSTTLQLQQHITAVNPHGTGFGDLSDVAFPGTIPAGSIPVWNDTTQEWEVSTATGLNPNSFVAVAGGSIVRVAEGNTALVAQEWRGPSGNRDTAPNLTQWAWNNGTAGAPTWALGAYVNPYGELRGRSTRDTGVPFRIERRASGSTGDLWQVVTETGAVLAWVNSKGQMRAPNLGRSILFSAAGAVTANPGKFSWWNDTGTDLVMRGYRFTLNTPGTTASTYDINLNGTTLYPTGKPTMAINATTVQAAASFTIPAGQRITIDVDVAGASSADLSAQIEVW